AETHAAHHLRLRAVLAKHALQRWPYPGVIGVREVSLTGERTDVHVLRDWRWLGTARSDAELASFLEAPPRAEFDLDIYRLLVKHLPKVQVYRLGP
ncbi:MAG TPA: hypothetical protein VF420_15310, partial [Casimicrobiaceae bacterium]